MKTAILVAVLTAWWPDGTITRTPATTMDACLTAAQAWSSGLALPLDAPGRATHVRCDITTPPIAGFKPGWDCIEGFNCERK